MVYFVIAKSEDSGPLGRRIDADTPEEAAARISRTIVADEPETMVVRWNVARSRKGEVLSCRIREVEPSEFPEPGPEDELGPTQVPAERTLKPSRRSAGAVRSAGPMGPGGMRKG